MAVVKNNKLFGSNVVIEEVKETAEVPEVIVEFIKEQEAVINYNLVVKAETFEEFYTKQIDEEVKKEEEEVQPKKKGRKAKK